MTGKVKAMWQEQEDAKEEEDFLIDQYESARWAEEQAKGDVIEAQSKLNRAKKSAEDARQAIIDYMQGNGLTKSERLSLSVLKTRSVDIEDIDSVPEEYVRIKKEVNKAAIKALNLPESNWLKYSEKETIKLTVKGV